MKTEVLRYGEREISYTLERTARKRLRIVVRPDLSVRVAAPLEAEDVEVQRAMRGKAAWIARQIDALEAFHPLPTPGRYVSGETIRYLGRQYRLKVEKGDASPAKLRDRFLWVRVEDSANRSAVKGAVDAWFLARARDVFHRSLERCMEVAARQGIDPPQLAIRSMRTRWGSCSASGRITLNLKLVQTPAHCVEYVLMHELCHLRHHDHSRAFYRLLTTCMPDWEQRKAVLRSWTV